MSSSPDICSFVAVEVEEWEFSAISWRDELIWYEVSLKTVVESGERSQIQPVHTLQKYRIWFSEL
jgi:hypothetical protein